MGRSPKPYAEVLDYTSFNNFLGTVLDQNWSKKDWAVVIHFLHQRGLANLPAISPVDGLSAIGLSSLGCSAPDGEIQEIVRWVVPLMGGRSTWRVSLDTKWKALLAKIFSGRIDPKRQSTWAR